MSPLSAEITEATKKIFKKHNGNLTRLLQDSAGKMGECVLRGKLFDFYVDERKENERKSKQRQEGTSELDPDWVS